MTPKRRHVIVFRDCFTVERVVAYIDGFNYYHRIDDYFKASGKNYKPLNYCSLINSILNSQSQILKKVYFFTAINQKQDRPDRQEVIMRHKKYISQLESVGIETVYGKFHYNLISCRNCGYEYEKPVEKRTDVNIAVEMLSDGLSDVYDFCFLFSGDTDLIPPIQRLKSLKPEKNVIVFPPPDHKHKRDYNHHIHHAFKQAGCVTYTMRFSMLKPHLFE